MGMGAFEIAYITGDAYSIDFMYSLMDGIIQKPEDNSIMCILGKVIKKSDDSVIVEMLSRREQDIAEAALAQTLTPSDEFKKLAEYYRNEARKNCPGERELSDEEIVRAAMICTVGHEKELQFKQAQVSLLEIQVEN